MPPLPPFPFHDMDREQLVRFGIVSRLTAESLPEYRPYENAAARGLLLCAFNLTQLAIAYWVPAGATLRQIMDHSGGSCDPAVIRRAIQERGL